ALRRCRRVGGARREPDLQGSFDNGGKLLSAESPSETLMKNVVRFSLAAGFALAIAAPALAQPYTAIKTGNVIELKDAKADMVVPVVINVGRPWRIQVKGKDLVRAGMSA